MALFIVGLVVFLGIHLIRVAAPGLRTRMIASTGDGPYRGVYSLVSILSLVLLIYGFGVARQQGGVLYDPPVFLRHVTLLLMLIALIVFAAGFLPSGYIATYAKHPQVLGVKTWAFAHLLANGGTAQVILFAAFLAWGVILRISYRRRARDGEITERRYQSWTYDVAAVVIGAVIYALFFWKLHEWLIGVPIMVM
jgi:uncharacterized membrane protein